MAKLLGFKYRGKLVTEFNVRLLTVGGECAAQEEIAELGLDNLSNPSATQKRLSELAYLAQQVGFANVPRSEITAQFLFDNLLSEDYWTIVEAIFELRKKRSDVGASEANQPPEAQTS